MPYAQAKRFTLRPEQHGLLLFAFQGKLYHYRVCHFGGRFSAFWWQRAGAFLLRQVHGLLAWKPHKAFLFVDDLLCALFRDSAPDMFALAVLFFCTIAAPISWKKAQFQDSLVWCGWEINFSHDTIQLVSAKLNSPSGSMHLIPPQTAVSLRASLNKDLKTNHSLPGLWSTVGSKILEILGRTMHCPQDIPQVPGTSKPTWARIADPNNPYTSLSKSSQQCLTWLASCFRHSPVQSLAL